jgi:transcription antitermination factor NusG
MAFFSDAGISGPGGIDAAQWFAVQVKPPLTNQLVSVLEQKGFETFTPSYRMVHRWRDRTSETEIPFFSGYVFSRFEFRRRMPLLTTPGVYGVVSFGNTPAPIPQQEIESIRRASSSGLAVEACPWAEPGEKVRIVSGPLVGMEGTLLRNKNGLRVVVGITLIERALAVEVDADSIRPYAPHSLASPRR